MNIIIFGATGGTGKELVKQALEQGYNVTAFVRDVLRMPVKHHRLALSQGNALNPAQVELAVKNHDAVLSALGSPIGGKNPTKKTICSEGTENIINAMKRQGIKRLVVESTYGAYEAKASFYTRFLWLVAGSNMKDKEIMENLIQSSGLEWVIARPVALTNGPKKGRYKAGEDINAGFWRPTISRADTAEFMVRMLVDDSFLFKKPVLSY